MSHKSKNIFILYNYAERPSQQNSDNKLALKFVEYLDQKCGGNNVDIIDGNNIDIIYHDKSAIPGSLKIDSLERNIKRADLIFVILTPKFENNGWTKFSKELAVHMKQFKGTEEGNVIPILVGKVEKIPTTFQMENRFIEFDEEFEKNGKMWDVLCMTIREHLASENKYKEQVGAEGANKLRKPKDDTFNYKLIPMFSEGHVHRRIGIIKAGRSQGTGFRAGDLYVISAYHIFESLLENLWDKINLKIRYAVTDVGEFDTYLSLNSLREEERKQRPTHEKIESMLQSWKEKVKPTATFKDLIETGVFKDKKEEICKFVNNAWNENTEIKFGYMLEDSSTTEPYALDADIPYYSKENDIIVLKLKEKENITVPHCFELEVGPVTSPMHLIGHPDGDILQFDPKCIVYTKDTKEKLKEDTRKAYEYCKENHKNWLEKMEEEYNSLLSYDIIFHCSGSTVQGASGSPGIITVQGTSKGTKIETFKVQAMLQTGHPETLYYKLCRSERNDISQTVFFEKGITMTKLYDLLQGHERLRDNLFQETIGTETDQPRSNFHSVGQMVLRPFLRMLSSPDQMFLG